jgi:uncharacterized tellurite resistance protein B-like protein
METYSNNTVQLDEKISQLTRKLMGSSKFALVRSFYRYQQAKAGKLEHNVPADFIEANMQAIRRVLQDKYGVDNAELIKLIGLARKKRPRPLV